MKSAPLHRTLRLAYSVLLASGSWLLAQTAPTPPPYLQLRYDENYSYLRNTAARSDYFDPVKYIPLNAEHSAWATLGGEIRERYEYYRNSLWGRGPQDTDGYLLERYMLHADVHFADYFRVFTQLKSGLENGRNGGPRATDEDRLDFLPAVFLVRFSMSGPESPPLRAARTGIGVRCTNLVFYSEGQHAPLSLSG